MQFLIIVTGYNCADNVLKCYQSLAIQNEIWRAVFIDDASTDNTAVEMFKINDNRICKQHFVSNAGAAYRRFKAIKQYGKPDDIVVLVGMDDCLMQGALTRIAQEYLNGKLMTYGNWVRPDGTGLPKKFTLSHHKFIHKNRDYRKDIYRSTAPNTFIGFLFDAFDEDDFIVDGEWIKATTESPLMFGLLEMCGEERIGVIYDKIYLYQRDYDNNAQQRFGKQYQKHIYSEIIKRPKKELWK